MSKSHRNNKAASESKSSPTGTAAYVALAITLVAGCVVGARKLLSSDASKKGNQTTGTTVSPVDIPSTDTPSERETQPATAQSGDSAADQLASVRASTPQQRAEAAFEIMPNWPLLVAAKNACMTWMSYEDIDHYIGYRYQLYLDAYTDPRIVGGQEITHGKVQSYLDSVTKQSREPLVPQEYAHLTLCENIYHTSNLAFLHSSKRHTVNGDNAWYCEPRSAMYDSILHQALLRVMPNYSAFAVNVMTNDVFPILLSSGLCGLTRQHLEYTEIRHANAIIGEKSIAVSPFKTAFVSSDFWDDERSAQSNHYMANKAIPVRRKIHVNSSWDDVTSVGAAYGFNYTLVKSEFTVYASLMGNDYMRETKIAQAITQLGGWVVVHRFNDYIHIRPLVRSNNHFSVSLPAPAALGWFPTEYFSRMFNPYDGDVYCTKRFGDITAKEMLDTQAAYSKFVARIGCIRNFVNQPSDADGVSSVTLPYQKAFKDQERVIKFTLTPNADGETERITTRGDVSHFFGTFNPSTLVRTASAIGGPTHLEFSSNQVNRQSVDDPEGARNFITFSPRALSSHNLNVLNCRYLTSNMCDQFDDAQSVELFKKKGKYWISPNVYDGHTYEIIQAHTSAGIM